MMSHLSYLVGMGGIRELLDGKIWEWDGNGNEVIELGGNWYENSRTPLLCTSVFIRPILQPSNYH